jgi:hypothetical protein
VSDIQSRLDALADQRLKICQDQVSIVAARFVLLEAVRNDIHEAATKAEKDRDAVINKVNAALAKAGIVLETMDAWPANRNSAEVQLAHFVGKSELVRAAAAANETLVAMLPPCDDLIRETWSAIEDAEWRLEKLVNTMVTTSRSQFAADRRSYFRLGSVESIWRPVATHGGSGFSFQPSWIF